LATPQLEAVHKRLHNQGGGVFFRCGRPHFLVQKNLTFFRNLCCVRTDKRVLSQLGHFSDKEGVNFSRFCADLN